MTLLLPSLALSAQPTLSWNLVADLQDMLQYPFMVHAFAAGTIIAIIAGALGYFVVLRGMAFASHTLANIGFAGAAGAALVGVNPVFGLLAFTFVGAAGMGALGRRIYGRDVAVGIVLAVALALGLLFINLYHGYATNAYSILFGDVLGVSAQDVAIALAVGALTLVALASVWRPLLFASLDEEVAEARGLPVRWLALGFLLLLGLVVAEAVQIVGVLLIFALLVTPAAIAERLTRRPGRALLLAVAIALFVTWAGIFIAYYYPYPLGFFISTLAFALYLLARIGEIGARWLQGAHPGAPTRDGLTGAAASPGAPANAGPAGAAHEAPANAPAKGQLEGGVA
ncbi:MAG TPA: metal ABC transporter permease [Ktedonobacterales bacterium]|nr:metal ABC transporter permease [Ktedonobacterales bacterium]